jgi:hypothetical protein
MVEIFLRSSLSLDKFKAFDGSLMGLLVFLSLSFVDLIVRKIGMNVFGNARGLNLLDVRFGKEGKRGELR